jgi:hypothetical protein
VPIVAIRTMFRALIPAGRPREFFTPAELGRGDAGLDRVELYLWHGPRVLDREPVTMRGREWPVTSKGSLPT